MPQIIDFTYGYSTSTAGTTVVVDTPNTTTATNAILVAICSSDTGASNWSSAGWTQYYGALANTTGSALLWRAVTLTEAASYTFTATIAETLNCTILSIIDVNSTSPFDANVNSNMVAANTVYPTFSATLANELILFIATHGSVAVQPSAIEGPVTQLWSWDGSAHSDSIAWTIHPTTGVTPTVISSVTGTTYNGKLITVGIKPPATGATIIPAYCAQDLSKYVDPLHGTTAFRGNTAFSGTATTYFGTTIGGKAHANGTVTARTDIGINTYRSCAGHTSSINRTWQGCVLPLLAGNILTAAGGKNILCHVIPYLPIDMQTLEGVSVGRGVALGAYSTANNFKVWHVHGANTPFGAKRVPVIINTSSTTGILQTTGTLNANSIAGFGFFASGFTTSADIAWTMLWVLDTTTICGGNATYPINTQGIVKIVADGKERISAIQQGSSQVLLLQPVQIGNGINSTYLSLDSTAIEFPQQYNQDSGQIYYCSTNNVAGLTYYASATDTIIHRNSVISSASDYHWRIHASSSASATYDFSGLSLIGAGDVQLRAVTTFSEVSFTSCTTVAQNSAVISNCSIDNSYIVSNAPNLISNSSFKFGVGHAIEITAPGTYTFTGNTFTGYGAIGTTNAAIYNNSGGSVTLNITSGGSTPTYRNGVGATTTIVATALITLSGLVAGTEVRAYVGIDPATSTEIGGVEASTTSFVFSQSVAGQAGYIQIFHVEYQPVFLSLTYSGSDTEYPIQQIIDRQYTRGTIYDPS
jgi:hypothetical protein